ncbi:hypothetical protein BCUE_0125 [Candidatus Kinetoplastibacterium blastocrithidii TCC012E]|uniref:Uncharacterized protein n=1 Tax=Candidatus Kinetoplastidibacterium blastocrithidiae TCC012E TaxID=1208922 RepID=M1M4V8_9PROT|nr:DUF493 domain-containing protein [Candidatus Kinetoplastibacterium blastocrithidii]AFZ83293.1 hypothetical protein CKBE_00104 [Candidatus Kinetoplastibacterium blastocrithidii (ex Strigomonas culicis)]AGF50109.1 hypothetical protein BCUE_0125 [Candidatus Kinetoplastibacterium blastocrithidii TCC012E]
MTTYESISDIYPNNFPVKIIGKNDPGFADDIFSILNSSDINIDYSHDNLIISKSGKYVSLTLNVNVVSRDHFDNIYKLLYASPKVFFIL